MSRRKTSDNVFFCDRPFHILNAINFVSNNILNTRNNSDIIIINSFLNARSIANALKRTGVFVNVMLIDVKFRDIRRPIWKRIYLRIAEVWDSLQNKNEKKMEVLRKKKWNYEVNFKNFSFMYSKFFVPSWGTIIWKELALCSEDKPHIYFLDDGMYSRNNWRVIISPVARGIVNKVRKFCKLGKYALEIDKIYLNNPKSIISNNTDIEPLPTISKKNIKLLSILSETFEYHSVVNEYPKFVFIEQPFIDDVYQAEAEIIDQIAKVIGQNNFAIRLHPAHKNNSHIDSFPQCSAAQMWELEWIMGNITEENMLIGIASTAMLTPKLLYGYEPTVICLHKLSAFNKMANIDKIDAEFQALRNAYTHKERVIIVENEEELKNILLKL